MGRMRQGAAVLTSLRENGNMGGSEADIIRNIRKGIPGTQMPPFPMTEEEAQARGQS